MKRGVRANGWQDKGTDCRGSISNRPLPAVFNLPSGKGKKNGRRWVGYPRSNMDWTDG